MTPPGCGNGFIHAGGRGPQAQCLVINVTVGKHGPSGLTPRRSFKTASATASGTGRNVQPRKARSDRTGCYARSAWVRRRNAVPCSRPAVTTRALSHGRRPSRPRLRRTKARAVMKFPRSPLPASTNEQLQKLETSNKDARPTATTFYTITRFRLVELTLLLVGPSSAGVHLLQPNPTLARRRAHEGCLGCSSWSAL